MTPEEAIAVTPLEALAVLDAIGMSVTLSSEHYSCLLDSDGQEWRVSE